MSDGHSKAGASSVAPELEPEPLDDIILGEDEETPSSPSVGKPPPPPAKASASNAPPPPAKVSGPPPPIQPGEQAKAERPADAEGRAIDEPRKRAKMTLRIPDDEVSRPQLPVAPPSGDLAGATGAPSAPPAPPSPAQPLPPPPAPAPVVADGPPIEPQRIIAAADDTLELPSEEVRARMTAITNEVAPPAIGIDTSNERGWTPYQPSVGGRNAGATLVDARERMSSSLPSEEIPIDTDDDVPDPSEDELATRPRLPSDHPSGPDSEDVKLDELEGERLSDPADEIDPEDFVSVDSLPAGAHKPKPVASASTLIATTPQAPAVAPSPPSPPGPVGAPVQATPVAAPRPPAAGSPGIVGTSTPAVPFRPIQAPSLVAPVGALAPPPMNEAATGRKKARPWWEELFNDDFLRTMAKVTEGQIKGEVDFIEESLGCEAGAMVLDLACGTGRHAVELASRGYQVVGYDLSLAMLARASDEAQDRKQKINFVQGDMRDMTFEETFDGVYAWNTSFGYFDEEKNAAVVGNVHRSLKKGGQFLLDVINRDFVIRQAPSLAWFEGDGCICMDEMQIDFITSRMKVKRTMMMDDGRTKEIEYSIRLYALHELGKMLHDSGFRVAEVSGRTATPGVYFGNESPRTLILAEKR